MMKKVVWLICMNVQPPDIDTHLRHQKFAQYLEDDGYDVYIIGASYLHYSKIQLIDGKDKYIQKNYSKLKYIFVKVSSYSENTGFKRIFSIVQFAWNLFRLKYTLPKPDIVVHNTRIPFDLPIYWAVKKLKARYITETWDLWPLSFDSSGSLKPKNPLMRFFYNIEKYYYTKADRCIFTLAGCKQYIIDHGWDLEHDGSIDLKKIYYINNGIDLNESIKQKEQFKLPIPELEDKESIKIIYLGSIGHVNAVDMIIETAKLFVDRPEVRFLIFGKGSERASLEEKVKAEKIGNVKFLNEWVEIKYVPYILSCADINLLNCSHYSALKYGGSQGKLFQYLAAGKPIVSNNIMGYDIINSYGAGISENINTPEQYKDVICSILDDKDRYDSLSEACKNAAENFDLRTLYQNFKSVIDGAV